MLWDFKLVYHGISIQEIKYVLRPQFTFYEIQARKPLQTDDKKHSTPKTPLNDCSLM